MKLYKIEIINTNNTMYTIIAAIDINCGISKLGKIPWNITDDIKHFYNTTKNHIVIMSVSTYENIPIEHRPLKDRINIVISDKPYSGDVLTFTISQCIQYFQINAKKYSSVTKFIIGDGDLYTKFIKAGLVSRMIISHVYHNYNCDKFFGNLVKSADWNIKSEKMLNSNPRVKITTYTARNKDEDAVHMMYKLIQSDYTLFGGELRFTLNDTFPGDLSVFDELMRDISGKFVLGNINPYGFQLRHFGAMYTGLDNYDGQGYDQLINVINNINNNNNNNNINNNNNDNNNDIKSKYSTINVFSIWAPSSKVAPDISVQFYTYNNLLSCKLTTACSDIMEFKHIIARYALLTYMVAKVCKLTASELIWSLGITYLDPNQIEEVKVIANRVSLPYPRIHLDDIKSIDDFTLSNITLY